MSLTLFQKYWNASSAGYSDINREELDTDMRGVWLSIIEKNRPEGKPVRILDAGCGPGFFSVLMAQEGHEIEAVDFSPDMLARARENAVYYGVSEKIRFQEADVSELPFADNTFDLILSRNITWTLQNPTRVYREWLRVLKRGGRFLNFDANWNRHYYDEGLRLLMEQDFRELESLGYHVERSDGHYRNEEDNWVLGLPLNHEDRPAWDVKTLLSLGCTDVRVVTRLPDEIMNLYYRTYYRHIPVFMVCAEKTFS